MPAGPKKAVDSSPLPFESDRHGAERFADWCEQFVIVPKGHGVGGPMVLRDWQVDMLRPILDPDVRPSIAGIMLPRGNGKTSLMAALALYELFEGPDGNQIPVVAVDERQSGLTLKAASRMVELSPELVTRAQIYRDHIAIPTKGSTLTALPAEAKRLEGLGTWTLAIADEIGVIGSETWQTLLLGLGKVPNACAIGIGTPPNTDSSVLHDMREHSKVSDPTFAWVEYSADEFQDHPVDCQHCWTLANPALDDFLTRESMHALLPPKTPEGAYRRARLCQLVSENANPFLDVDTWAGLSTGEAIPDGAEVVIGLDGSFGGKDADGTALVIATVSPVPHLDVLGLWESDGSPDWRVPILEVEKCILDARSKYKVREVVGDPFRWQRSLQVLSAKGMTVSEHPWSPSRVTKATTAFHSAAVNDQLSHSGDSRLAAHIAGATVTENNGALRITKTSRKRSAAKIDLAAAALMAYSRASWLAAQPHKSRKVWSFTN